MLDVQKIRKNFPFLKQKINNNNIIFFDTAASSQKPQIVINTIQERYTDKYSNINRSSYFFSQNITNDYEKVRIEVQKFINAKCNTEIIFTKNTTESINLVAYSLIGSFIENGDEILLTEIEHHSNIIPWYLMKKFKKINIKYIKINKQGLLNIKNIENLLNNKTKIISISHCSNVIGNINSIKKIIAEIRKYLKNVLIIVDGAQSILHTNINVQDLNCDFFVFSAHKLYGPTGVGVLYAKKKWHDIMSPFQGGGGMVKNISSKEINYAPVPFKFEAGTPNIVGVLGLGSAINYIKNFEICDVQYHETLLCSYFLKQSYKISQMKIIGINLPHKIGIFTFIIDGIHSHDIGVFLNLYGICVRTGHHCAQPLLNIMGYHSTLRVSFGIYNTINEIDFFFSILEKAIKIFNK